MMGDAAPDAEQTSERHSKSGSERVRDHGGAILNNDILLYIMRYLHLTDVFPLAYTCRTLYVEGTKLLLRRQINLNHRNIRSFCTWVLANDGWRAPFLRRISVNLSSVRKRETLFEVEEPLARVLALVENLASISLSYTLYQASPEVIEAISRLTNLKSLSLHDGHPSYIKMVSDMCSPFVHVYLGCSTGFFSLHDEMFRFRDHLKAIRLYRSYLGDAATNFPSVHSLEMRWVQPEDFNLIPILFPNLIHLGIRDIATFELEDAQVEENRIRQATRHRVAYPWPSLAYVSGSLQTLYMLAFTRFIRRVDIRELWIPELQRGGWFTFVLSATQPTHLSLDLIHPRFAPKHLDLPGLLLAASQVTHLRLECRWFRAEKLDMEEFTDNLLKMLRTVSLKHLQLILRRPRAKRGHPAICFMFDTDLRLFTERIVDAAPTLQFISVNMWQRTAHFAVSRPSSLGKDRLRQVSPIAAQTYVAAEWRSS
ncbi:hypothetical protein OBBRIDRAFT_840103 [Obba rivulosa]|uniref:F-box domain-containing protein n=1 Tax=Obba rivulosa TaxID=1052685 RepID=A0A8E2AI87_9APHY|nr:hypothetical protein OBBRIDRAFT_840103 [Obba rivulosa]